MHGSGRFFAGAWTRSRPLPKLGRGHRSISNNRIRAVSRGRRERTSEPARMKFCALPDQTARVRDLAGGLDQLKGIAASVEGLGPRTVSLKPSTPAAWVENETARSALRPERGATANRRARFLQSGPADSGREQRNHMTLCGAARCLAVWGHRRAAARNPSDDHC